MGYGIAALLALGAIALIAGGLYVAYRLGYRDGYRDGYEQRAYDSPLGAISDAFAELARAISGCGINFDDLPERDEDDGR